MSPKHRFIAAIFASTFLAFLLLAQAATAGETGTLKLKVRTCAGSNWMSGAKVDLVLYRFGVGVVGEYRDETDTAGYVEIAMEGLEAGDEARVTITPVGMDPDDEHLYVWVASRLRIPGYWDVGYEADALCDDGWYDQQNNIILALYH